MSIVDEVRALESSLKAEKSRADRARREAEDAVSKNQELSRQLSAERRKNEDDHARLMKQIDDLRLVNKRITTEHDSLRAIAGNTDSARRSAAVAEKAKSEAADAKARVQSLTADLTAERDRHGKDNVRAHQDISNLSEINRRLTDQSNSLRAEVTNIRGERDRLRKAIASPAVSEKADSDIKDLRAKVDSLAADKRAAEHRADTSESRLAAHVARADASQRRVTDLEESLRNSARLLSESRKEVTGMKEQVAKATGEADHARRAAGTALTDTDGLSINKHIATLKVQADNAQRRVTELETSMTRSAGQLADARDEANRLKQRLATVIGEAESHRRVLAEKDIEIQGLRIKLNVAQGRQA